MAKINVVMAKPKTQKGEEIDLTPTREGGGSYALIAPGYYNAVVRRLQTLEEENAVYSSRDGQTTYLKLRPDIRLVETRTIINRQDFTCGLYDEKRGLYSDKPGESPVWGGFKGAQGLLTALGLFKALEGGKFELDFDTAIVSNRVVRVRVGIAGYIKGDWELTKQVQTPRDFDSVMTALQVEMTGLRDWNLADLDTLVPAFNKAHDLDEDSGLKTKNMITSFYGVRAWDIDENDWYLHPETNQVFVSEQDFDDWFNPTFFLGSSNGFALG
jgi:hypothetical protein